MNWTDELARLHALHERAAHPACRPPLAEPGDEGFVEHPDGWHWSAPDGQQRFGPFDSMADARRDRERGSEQTVDETEFEREAERELGIDDALEEDLEGRHADDPDRGV
jgi:hypothetical protein